MFIGLIKFALLKTIVEESNFLDMWCPGWKLIDSDPLSFFHICKESKGALDVSELTFTDLNKRKFEDTL
jgi:hypothetical protein